MGYKLLHFQPADQKRELFKIDPKQIERKAYEIFASRLAYAQKKRNSELNILGLDIGTTTISAVLVESDGMRATTSKTVQNTSHITSANAWENAQDPEKIWKICQELLAYFYRQEPKIDGIGITGQMHGIVYVDANGKACSNLATWQDARGNLPCREGKSYAAYLTDLCGYAMSTGFGLTTHFYNLANIFDTGVSKQALDNFHTVYCNRFKLVFGHGMHSKNTGTRTRIGHGKSTSFYLTADNCFNHFFSFN